MATKRESLGIFLFVIAIQCNFIDKVHCQTAVKHVNIVLTSKLIDGRLAIINLQFKIAIFLFFRLCFNQKPDSLFSFFAFITIFLLLF